MEPETAVWVGLDTSTRTFRVCVIDRGGCVLKEGSVDASLEPLEGFLDEYRAQIAGICVETGTTSVDITRKLTSRGYEMRMYNARHIHNFLRLRFNKTDSNDARGLAEVARIGHESLRKVHLKSVECARVRTQLVIRENLIKQRKGNEALMMSIFHMYGVRSVAPVYSERSLREQVFLMLDAVEADYGGGIREQIIPLLELCVSLRRTVKEMNNSLRRYAVADPVCKRFLAIPGIGVISALSFMTAVGDPGRFPRGADVGAYFGLTPKIWQTGRYSRRTGISKVGSSMTRKHLHSAAKAAMNARKPNALQAWANRLAERTNRRKAAVALSRKLSVLMLAMWKNGTGYEQPTVAQA